MLYKSDAINFLFDDDLLVQNGVQPQVHLFGGVKKKRGGEGRGRGERRKGRGGEKSRISSSESAWNTALEPSVGEVTTKAQDFSSGLYSSSIFSFVKEQERGEEEKRVKYMEERRRREKEEDTA